MKIKINGDSEQDSKITGRYHPSKFKIKRDPEKHK